MSIASFFSRRKRVLVFCGVTLLLHWMALGWVGAHVAPLTGNGAAQPAPIVAQLHLAAPPEPTPVAAPPPRAKAVTAKRRPKPLATAPAQPATQAVTAAADAAPVDGDGKDGGGAAPEAQAAQPEPPAQPAEAPAVSAPAVPQPPRYKASVPPSAALAMTVKRIDPDGTVWNGEASMAWKVAGGSYRMTVDVGVSLLVARVNLVALTSEGSVGEGGFAPLTMTEKRRGRSQTATHFDYGAGRITFSASSNQYPLAPGAQDKATLPLQLAAIARAGAGQLGGDLEIMVGEDRDATVFRFVVLGPEVIATGMGELQTVHLSRPPRPGAYNSRLDVWLAPGYEWYPVQVRNTEASGAVTTQTIKAIQVTDSER